MCIAHNFKGYDSYFILKYLYDNKIRPGLIMNGAKIMELSVNDPDIRFIDSLNFLPMPLSKFDIPHHGFEEGNHSHHPARGVSEESQTVCGSLSLVVVCDTQTRCVHSTQCRRETRGALLFGWVLRGNTHRVRVSRVFLPRMPQVLSRRHAQPGQRFDHARTVRKDASENDVLETTRLASGGNVGMRVSRFSSTGRGGQRVRGGFEGYCRSAFYGGRVNAVKLLVKTEANPTTKIKYVDFTSLYPDINKNGVYPGASLELNLAVEMGYKVVKIHEVWHFPDKTDRLFRDYIDMFLKKKQEASGWSGWCQTDKDKERYLQDYKDKEGIELDRDAIEYNAGARTVWKQILNNLWGKMGQRPNCPKTKVVADPKYYFELLTSAGVEVTNVNLVNDEVVEMFYTMKDLFVEASDRTNVVLAAFTTAQARIKLYKVMRDLGRRVCYYDTDSVVYTVKEGEWEPPLCDHLGELTTNWMTTTGSSCLYRRDQRIKPTKRTKVKRVVKCGVSR